jgi:4-hydroxybenzoate polyprenyltransferase
MVLNDWADREEDRRFRPERPIPSGEIRAEAAAAAGGALALGAWGMLPNLPTLLLLGCIVVYTCCKNFPWGLGPVWMAGCRLLALWIGAGAPAVPTTVWWTLALVWALAISGVSLLAAAESRDAGGLGRAAGLAVALWIGLGLQVWQLALVGWQLIPWALLVWTTLRLLWRCRCEGRVTPPQVGRWLGLLPLLQSGALFAMGQPVPGWIFLGLWPLIPWFSLRVSFS